MPSHSLPLSLFIALALLAFAHPSPADVTFQHADSPLAQSPITTFTYRDAGAHRVHLAGNFNAWAANVNGRISGDHALMSRQPDGAWTTTIATLPPIARFKFVIEDAQGRFTWHADPSIPERDADGNSVLLRPGADGRAPASALDAARFSIRIFSASGELAVILKDSRGSFLDALLLPALHIDDRPQSPLESTPHTPTTWRAPDSALSIESQGDLACALTWSLPDSTPRAFEARILDNSRYYAGGERFHALNHKGYTLNMASLDRPEDKGTASYKPVPFIISSRGYGLWLDSTSPSTFDLNSADRDLIKISDTAARLRLIFIAGPEPAAILSEFTRLTGRARVPPAWAFAPWKSRDVHRSRDELLADAELTRKHRLPGSVIVIDSPWETGYNDFNLNRTQFPDPDSLFARLRALGFLPCFWLTPFINSENVTDMRGIDSGPSRNFAEAAANNFLVRTPDGSPMIVPWWKGRGGLIDFTNPAATEWWQKQMEGMLPWGVAAIKCDDGESNFVQNAVFHDGSSARDMKGRYADLYLKAAHDFLEHHRPGDHTLIARCGFTGTGRYPFGWAGDNYASFSFDNGLPGVIIAAQNASLSGLPLWGCDIAGYMGDATPELFIRWTQFAAFTPLMMVHMQSNKGPWNYGAEALDIYRDFANLHTRLYPYIDRAAHENFREGTPLIRPLLLAFPRDARAADERFEFLFGPDLLIAPMYQPGTRRAVYLPKGDWRDFWTGREIAGPTEFEADAPLDRIPIFVRAGAIIPMLPEGIDTLVPRSEHLDPSVRAIDDRRVLEIWPGRDGRLDDHNGLSATLSSTNAERTLTVTTNPARPIQVRLRFTRSAPRLDPPCDSCPARTEADTTVIDIPPTPGSIRLHWN